ncbi:MAG: pyruvate kinase [Gammaproteobacteria bacterium]|nr:pyruvate kinase [Gammaproteobacteria bacterium]
MNLLRRTKIVATLGPSTDDPEVMKAMIDNGLDIVRLNFSHGDAETQIKRAELVRDLSQKVGRIIGILVDLQGPKIRISRFRDNKIQLIPGEAFAIDIDLAPDAGNQHEVGCVYEDLPKDVKPGAKLLLDDGRIVLEATEVVGNRINCKVIVGGDLSNNKGINLAGGGLSAPALSDKDKLDIVSAAKIDADYLAISFPRCGDDIRTARKLMEQAGGNALMVSKIERTEALENINDILDATDAIMIARGDLGVEIGDAQLPPVQKRLIMQARAKKKAVITATQMMETMIENAIPTRAEVFDVANAVFDGTDAVMLSGETAVGKHPAKVIEAMSRICRETESQPRLMTEKRYVNEGFNLKAEAIAVSAMFIANNYNIKAIVALTESGQTALWMSRISSGIPVFAMSRHKKTNHTVCLYRGVYPMHYEAKTADHVEVNKEVIKILKQFGVVSSGDNVIITKGDLMGVEGETSALKIVTVDQGLLSD